MKIIRIVTNLGTYCFLIIVTHHLSPRWSCQEAEKIADKRLYLLLSFQPLGGWWCVTNLVNPWHQPTECVSSSVNSWQLPSLVVMYCKSCQLLTDSISGWRCLASPWQLLSLGLADDAVKTVMVPAFSCLVFCFKSSLLYFSPLYLRLLPSSLFLSPSRYDLLNRTRSLHSFVRACVCVWVCVCDLWNV